MPNHGVIQVDRSDGSSYTARVEHLDDYHFDLGEYGNVYHICQFGEMMERTGSTAILKFRRRTSRAHGNWAARVILQSKVARMAGIIPFITAIIL